MKVSRKKEIGFLTLILTSVIWFIRERKQAIFCRPLL